MSGDYIKEKITAAAGSTAAAAVKMPSPVSDTGSRHRDLPPLTADDEHEILYRDGRSEIRLEPVLIEHHIELCCRWDVPTGSAAETGTAVSCGSNSAAGKQTCASRSEAVSCLRYCGAQLFDLVCTPQYLEELVTGRLLTEGLIRGPEDILQLKISPAGDRADVVLQHDIADDMQRHDGTTLSENGNDDSIRPVPQLQPIPWKIEWIFAMADRFKQGMPLHDATWATHSCFLYREDQLLFQCEDIGRHNAMDKIIGYALRSGIDLSQCIVYTSGRVPNDMAMKAIRAGIPVLVSKSIPTRETIQLAKKYRLTLIGAARSDRVKVFHRAE